MNTLQIGTDLTRPWGGWWPNSEFPYPEHCDRFRLLDEDREPIIDIEVNHEQE